MRNDREEEMEDGVDEKEGDLSVVMEMKWFDDLALSAYQGKQP